MSRKSVSYKVRGDSKSKSDASTLMVEKGAKYKKELDAARQKCKDLAQENKQLVQALEAAKAKIIELEAAASRQRKGDSFYLSRKPKASRVTSLVKKTRGSEKHDDGGVGPMDDAVSLPDPSVDGRWEKGCKDPPHGVDGTPQRQHPAAVDVVDHSAVRHGASLPKKQRGANEKRGKHRGEKSERKKTADIEEEPAPQPAARAPYPDEKKPQGGKHRIKKSHCKNTEDTEEPTPKPAAPSLNTTEKQSAGCKSRSKKSQRKKIANCEKEQAPQPAVPSLPPPSLLAQHSGCTPPFPEPLDAAPTSSAHNDSGSECRPAGRPARTATKCGAYKLPSLVKKLRRP